MNIQHAAKILIALAATLGAALAGAQSESGATVGTWRLNLEESIPPQGKRFRPFTVTIRSSGEVLDFTQHDTDASGKTVTFTHKTPTDGQVREVPGLPGARAAMTLLPSGVIDAKLWFGNGTFQNKFCVLERSLRRQVCLATITAPQGEVSFFKHVLDKVD